MLSGLSQINIELTQACDRRTLCIFCGHQDPAIHFAAAYKPMPFELLEKIAVQIPVGVVVQFHRDGEPTAYRRLKDALSLFANHITSIVTHGENLVKRADDIIGNCASLTVSMFKGDPDGQLQTDVLKEFLFMKREQRPIVNIKVVGELPIDRDVYSLGVPVIRRVLHNPDGNYHYAQRDPTVPEHGICLDFLSHPSVDWQGRLFVCNRLDAEDKGLLGDLKEHSLDDLWNSPKRLEWLEAHKRGRRDQASPLCKDCLFYGVPTAP